MFTTEIGWGFDPSIGRVLRTTDGGLHWKDVTPAEAKPSSNTAVFFLDQNHGWLIVPPPITENPEPIPASPWYTTDGGVTWTRGRNFSYTGENQGGGLTFVDDQHGWYRANLGGQMGVFASAVFRTTDGGKQWDQVILNSAAPSEQSTQGSFPPCPISGLAFLVI